MMAPLWAATEKAYPPAGGYFSPLWLFVTLISGKVYYFFPKMSRKIYTI